MDKSEIKDMPLFKEFLQQLNENERIDQARTLSLMAWYLEGMEDQLDSILQKLAQIMKQQSLSNLVIKAVSTLELAVSQARKSIVSFQNRITESLKDGVKCFKDAGVSELDNAIINMDVKNGFIDLVQNLHETLICINDAIEKVERAEFEMGEKDAILDPMCAARTELSDMRNSTLVAIGNMENLKITSF